MKKQIYLISLISLFLLLPKLIYAECTKEEIEHFKEIESGYKVSYEYDAETKDYTLSFSIPEPKLFDYIAYVGEDAKIEEINENYAQIHNVAGQKYTIEIIGLSKTCNNEVLKSFTIDLERHNNFSDDPLCEGIEEFVLCQPTYDKEISYEDFVSRINTYKNSQKNKIDKNKTKTNNTGEEIFNYLEENLDIIMVVLLSVIAVVVLIILVAKKIKKSRRLE